MHLTENVKFIIDRLASLGYRADVVGGPVRDHILGITPHDFDITTDATPNEIKSAFSDLRTVDTGIKHGTVTVVIDGENYEITTYRIDGEYTDSRHPNTVEFTKSITADLARRDFTVNAIAYSPTHGYTDPFGGTEDIKKRIIRAVGDPTLRFSEDALRILRGIRFAATLGFMVDTDTASAIHSLAPTLSRVSAERIYTEFSKLLSGAHAYDVLMSYSDVIAVFLPELRDMHLPPRPLFDSADYMSRLVALFYLNAPSPDVAADNALRKLKTDNATRQNATMALAALPHLDTAKTGLTKLLSSVGEGAARLTLSAAYLVGLAPRDTANRLDALISSGVAYRVSDLAVRGGDLLALGLRGTEVGDALGYLLDLVIDGTVLNDHAALISAIANRKMKK